MANLENGKPHTSYSLHDGFLEHGSRLHVVKYLHEKFLYESHEPPCVGHCGVQVTTQAMETYFYWPSMRQDI